MVGLKEEKPRLSSKQALTFLGSKVSKKASFAAGTKGFKARKEAGVKLFLSLVELKEWKSRLSFKQALTFLVSKVSEKALFAAGTRRFRARKKAAAKLFSV